MSEESQTIEEIRAQYDGEWVLIEEPETDEGQQVKGGKVRFHSKDRDEVHRKAAELRLPYFALLYIGSVPRDVEFVMATFAHSATTRREMTNVGLAT